MTVTRRPADAPFVSTWLQGHVDVPFSKLVETFGEPQHTGIECDKSDAEWEFDTPHGVATIYNYKDGYNYNGPSGQPVEKITDWHIGGTTPEVVGHIKQALGMEVTA